ncbi:MAG: OmpA family protein [Paludibacteraceae bacterium]
MRNKLLTACLLVLYINTSLLSQEYNITDSLLSNSSIGLKTGANFPWMTYTNPDLKDYKNSVSAKTIFGFFAETPLNSNISLRPEFLFTHKGQKINNLGISYQIKSNYFEIRTPFLYAISLKNISPYIMAGPALSMATGGQISFGTKETSITDANLAKYDFSVIAGGGVKIPFHINKYPLTLTVEAAFNYGMLNSYGGKELDGEATALNVLNYDIDGTRKNRGIELTVSVSIPVRAIFSRKEEKVTVKEPESKDTTTVLVPKYINECYEIKDILALLNAGENANDKKICMYNLEFEFNKSVLHTSSIDYLNQITELLLKFKNIDMTIVGHTDSIGTQDSNLRLSKERALAVYNYLIKKGIKSSRLSCEFYGSTKPINSNETEEGRKKNRRVEFIVKNSITHYSMHEQKGSSGVDTKKTSLPEKESFSQDKTATSEETPGALEQYTNSASHKLSEGDYKGAVKDYTSALFYDSKNAETYNNRGVAYFNLGKYTAAIKDFKSALKINPAFEIARENKELAQAKRTEKTNRILDMISAGLNVASATLNTVSAIQTTNSGSSENYSNPPQQQSTANTTNSNNATPTLKRKTCSSCNGTGSCLTKEYPAEFGLGHSYKDTKCQVCGSYENHYHKPCPVCKGKGYTESYF